MRKEKTTGQIKMEGYFSTVRKKKDVIEVINKYVELKKQGKLRANGAYVTCLEDLNHLCKKYNLPAYPWRDVFEKMVNEGIDTEVDFSGPLYDVCNLRTFQLEPRSDDSGVQWANDNYPIAIGLSPYAVTEDIISYLNKNKSF